MSRSAASGWPTAGTTRAVTGVAEVPYLNRVNRPRPDSSPRSAKSGRSADWRGMSSSSCPIVQLAAAAFSPRRCAIRYASLDPAPLTRVDPGDYQERTELAGRIMLVPNEPLILATEPVGPASNEHEGNPLHDRALGRPDAGTCRMWRPACGTPAAGHRIRKRQPAPGSLVPCPGCAAGAGEDRLGRVLLRQQPRAACDQCHY